MRGVERPSGIDLSLSLRRRAPDAWDKCQVRRPLLEPPRRDASERPSGASDLGYLWTPRPVDCERATFGCEHPQPRVRPKTINYHRRPVTITPDRRKKEGDFAQSFFGMDFPPDMERAGMLLREYLDDKLRAPERVSEQEREQFLRIVQNIPTQNPQLESLIESVKSLFEMMQTRETEGISIPEGNLMTPADERETLGDDVPTVEDDTDEDNDIPTVEDDEDEKETDDEDDDDQGRGDFDPRHSSAAFGLPSYGTAVRSPQTQPITINSWEYGGTWSQLKATIESYGIRGRILDRSTGRENSIDTVVGKMIRGRKGGRKYKLYLERGHALLTLVGN